MVLFQPPSTPPTPWEFGFYPSSQMIEVIFWVCAVISIVFALLLLASYFNSRKTEHLYWGIAFALLWIILHQAIPGGDFGYFLMPVPAAFSGLIVGLFAVGLFKNVKPQMKIWGNLMLLYVVLMSFAIMFVKNNLFGTEYFGTQLLPSFVVPIVVMALHVPMAVLIIVLPILTVSENGKSAIMMTIAGALMGLVGLLLGLATLEVFPYPVSVGYLFVVLSIFPFVFLLAVIGFAWGTFVPKRWAFDIAGIELE